MVHIRMCACRMAKKGSDGAHTYVRLPNGKKKTKEPNEPPVSPSTRSEASPKEQEELHREEPQGATIGATGAGVLVSNKKKKELTQNVN